ncbi:MAG: hypothetical protein AVDCRST_MAG49-3004, partial [uncultured Thermomicrobiales bacterium]
GPRSLRRPAPPRPARRGRCRRRGGPRTGGAARRPAGVLGPPGAAQRALAGGRGDHRPARPRHRRRPAPGQRSRLRRHASARPAAPRPGSRRRCRPRLLLRRPGRGRHHPHHAATARTAEVPRRRGRRTPRRLGQHLARPGRRQRHRAPVPPVVGRPPRPLVRRLAVHRLGAL